MFCHFIFLLILALPYSATAVTISGNAHMQVAVPVTVTKQSDLAFGAFTGNNGGTVTITPQGTRSSGGAVTLLNILPSSAAAFRVQGTDGLQVNITLPESILIYHGVDGVSMDVQDFVSDPPTPIIAFSGDQIVKVGATLHMNPGQDAGDYTGTFDFTVDY